MRPGEVISDQLRLNISSIPTPRRCRNRLGVIAGDMQASRTAAGPATTRRYRAASPRGRPRRRLQRAPNNCPGDGVDGSDKPYLAASLPRPAELGIQHTSRHGHAVEPFAQPRTVTISLLVSIAPGPDIEPGAFFVGRPLPSVLQSGQRFAPMQRPYGDRRDLFRDAGRAGLALGWPPPGRPLLPCPARTPSASTYDDLSS